MTRYLILLLITAIPHIILANGSAGNESDSGSAESATTNPSPPSYVVVPLGKTADIGKPIASASKGWVLTKLDQSGQDGYFRTQLGNDSEELLDITGLLSPALPVSSPDPWETGKPVIYSQLFGCFDINARGEVVGYGQWIFGDNYIFENFPGDPDVLDKGLDWGCEEDWVGLKWTNESNNPIAYYASTESDFYNCMYTFLMFTRIDDDGNILAIEDVVAAWIQDEISDYDRRLFRVDGEEILISDSNLFTYATGNNSSIITAIRASEADAWIYEVNGQLVLGDRRPWSVNSDDVVIGDSFIQVDDNYNDLPYVLYDITDDDEQDYVVRGRGQSFTDEIIGTRRVDPETEDLVPLTEPEPFDWFTPDSLIAETSPEWSNLDLIDLAPDGVFTAIADKDGEEYVVLLLSGGEVRARSAPYGDVCFSQYPLNNLLAVWPDEILTLVMDIGQSHCATYDIQLPANSIVWTVEDHANPPDNTFEPDLNWQNPGRYTVHVDFSGSQNDLVVDVPDVGNIGQVALALQNPAVGTDVTFFAGEAIAWADSLQGTYMDRERNALQHSYWASLIASAHTSELSVEFTTAHEFTNREDGGVALDTTADLHNNLIGSQIIRTKLIMGNEVVDPTAIREALIPELENGNLWVINNDLQIIKSDDEKIIPLH